MSAKAAKEQHQFEAAEHSLVESGSLEHNKRCASGSNLMSSHGGSVEKKGMVPQELLIITETKESRTQRDGHHPSSEVSCCLVLVFKCFLLNA